MTGKRKHKDTDESSLPTSTYTFKLANGEPFDVQGVKVLVEQLVYKSIEHTNKRLKDHADHPPLSNILTSMTSGEEPSDEHNDALQRKKIKRTRRRYSREEKSTMVRIFDKYPIKEPAMEVCFLLKFPALLLLLSFLMCFFPTTFPNPCVQPSPHLFAYTIPSLTRFPSLAFVAWNITTLNQPHHPISTCTCTCTCNCNCTCNCRSSTRWRASSA
jgi:hypothetical protein